MNSSSSIRVILALLLSVSQIQLWAQEGYLVEGRNGDVWETIINETEDPQFAATNFGSVAEGTSLTKQFRITNQNEVGLQIPLIQTDSSFFSASPTEFESIKEGQSVIFNVTFSAGFGVETSKVVISANPTEAFAGFSFTVTGEGMRPRYVDASATGGNDGTSWGDAFVELQDALAVVGPGEEIRIAGGIYYPDQGVGQTNNDRDSSFTIEQSLTVRGGYPPGGGPTADASLHLTVLSGDLQQDDSNLDGNFIAEDSTFVVGQNSYHVVTVSSTSSKDVLLEGLFFNAGLADGSFRLDRGAGLVFGDDTFLTLSNCRFAGNFASDEGSAFWGSGPNTSLIIDRCEISGNAVVNPTSSAGPVCYYDGPEFVARKTLFEDNTIQDSVPAVQRGIAFGVSGFLREGGTAEISDCIIVGQISNDESSSLCHFGNLDRIEVDRCRLLGNTAGSGNNGGCIHLQDVNSALIKETVIDGNRGDVIGIRSPLTGEPLSLTLLNSTFVNNRGHLVRSGGNSINGILTIGNCVLTGNLLGIQDLVIDRFSLFRSHSIIQGLSADEDGNLDGTTDPGFINPIPHQSTPTRLGDYRLIQGSPLIDAGLNVSNTAVVDLNGLPRILDGTGSGTPTIDIGAFEYDGPSAPPEVKVTNITYNFDDGGVTLTVQSTVATTFTAQSHGTFQGAWTDRLNGTLGVGTNTVVLTGDQYDWLTADGRVFFRIVTPAP